MDILHWLESTGLAAWVRESSSIFAYPTILFVHSLGMTIVVGLGISVDMRLMGWAPQIPLEPLERLFPLMWLGFAINAFSGSLLLIADASTKFANPIFYIKLVFIAAALVVTSLMRRKLYGKAAMDKPPLTPYLKVLAFSSLVFWLGAITAGRLMAYLGPVSGLQ
jgi:hypothetical protein